MSKNPTPSSGREFKKILTSQGFTVTQTGGGHFKATHPKHQDKPPIWFAATPSDRRWIKNTTSWIRRTYGLDLKDIQ